MDIHPSSNFITENSLRRPIYLSDSITLYDLNHYTVQTVDRPVQRYLRTRFKTRHSRHRRRDGP